MLLIYTIIYVVLIIFFLIGVIFYKDAKKLWAKAIVWLLMLPFILSTVWMIFLENFY
jgi:hypothetical protein